MKVFHWIKRLQNRVERSITAKEPTNPQHLRRIGRKILAEDSEISLVRTGLRRGQIKRVPRQKFSPQRVEAYFRAHQLAHALFPQNFAKPIAMKKNGTTYWEFIQLNRDSRQAIKEGSFKHERVGKYRHKYIDHDNSIMFGEHRNSVSSSIEKIGQAGFFMAPIGLHPHPLNTGIRRDGKTPVFFEVHLIEPQKLEQYLRDNNLMKGKNRENLEWLKTHVKDWTKIHLRKQD